MSDRDVKPWPELHSPEDADATHRWARACLELWEQERVELMAEVERLCSAYAGLAAAVRELTGMSSLGVAAEATGVVTPAQRVAIDATERSISGVTEP